MRGACIIDGCVEPVLARNWCRAHYRRWWRYGDPTAGGARRLLGRTCSVEGCDAKHEARGFCAHHYKRWMLTGDPLSTKPLPRSAFSPGHVPWNAGTAAEHVCAECGAPFVRYGRARRHRYCSKACQYRAHSGEAHHAWRGGVTSENERLRKSAIYADWRAAVFLRDDYICRHCGARGVALQAHHVEAWAVRPDLRFDLDNGLTLCEPCHHSTSSYGRMVGVQ